MEMLVMDGAVQPQLQPHKKTDRSADQESDAHSPRPPDHARSRFVTCRPDELRPHPGYTRHHLTVPADKLSVLAERGDLAFREPISITHNHTVIDGYARWELARHQGRSALPCLEYDLSEADALQWILRTHQRSNGLNSFSRIMLALDLESLFQEKARSNQRLGGQYKGSSNLTEPDKLDVRAEIAAAAGASVGNVGKVKYIKTAAQPEIIEGLRVGEISIHRAWKWCQTSPVEQRQALYIYRTERGIRKTIRESISRHRSNTTSTPLDLVSLGIRLSALRPNQLASARVIILKSPGKAVYLTEEMANELNFEQPSLCETDNL